MTKHSLPQLAIDWGVVLLIAVGLLTDIPGVIGDGAQASNYIDWEPYEYKTRTGETISDCEIGRLVVPERHEEGTGSISLAFIRFRCTGESPGSPIVWLAGGPSDFGSDDIEGPYLALVREFQKHADVIALDQRGTGLTRPRLDCPENGSSLPFDVPFDRELALAEYKRLSRECVEHFANEGVDLSAYNTAESAHDVAALAGALGIEKVSLYGASYGTHLGLAIAKLHPEIVDRIVFSGVEGPNHTWKLPSNIDRYFERVFDLTRAQPELIGAMPDVEWMLRAVLERLREKPVVVELPAEGDEEPKTIVLGEYEVKRGLGAFYGSRSNLAQLPALLKQMYEGDFVSTGSYLQAYRHVNVHSAMYYAMECASAASPERLARIQEETSYSLAGELNFPMPYLCEAWPHETLPPSYRDEVTCDRPALFLSGTLDGQTPPNNAVEAAQHFSNATHVTVDGGSHQQLELHPPELPQLLGRFFAGDAVADTTITLPLEFAVPDGVPGAE